MSAAASDRPWWHRLSIRLSVRSALILVFGIGFALWIALAPGLERHRATMLILQHSGSYLYDYQFMPPSRFFKNPQSPYPTWARKALGDEHFHHITLVDIRKPDFGDKELVRLKSLDRIDTMRIEGVTDDGLTHFPSFPRLKQLFLNRCKISDTGIDNLGDELLGRLDFLGLQDTPITQAKVDELRGRYPKLNILGKPRFTTTPAP